MESKELILKFVKYNQGCKLSELRANPEIAIVAGTATQTIVEVLVEDGKLIALWYGKERKNEAEEAFILPAGTPVVLDTGD